MNNRSRFRVLSSRFVFMFGSGCGLFMFMFVGALGAQQPVDGPQYVNNDHLVRPANYREWVFIGSGIGLTGAKQIVAQHGGMIGVQSAEGEGSTFTLRLPLVPD